MLPVQVSSKHKVICVPYSEKLANISKGNSVKEITIKGSPHIIVPHDAAYTFLLRQWGYDVPAPILSHYNWAHGTPFEVQKKTCALLSTTARAYVLNSMGTGKTKSALWAWDYLNSTGHCGRLLVCAPLSTLKFTWGKEIFATLPHRRYEILHGTREKRLELLANTDVDIYVINHDGIKIIQEELKKRPDIDVLVLDELAVYRNGTAERSKVTRQVAKRMNWVWGMTGSPIPQCPTDAWAQAQIVTPNTVPQYYGRFRDELMTKVSTFKWVPKSDAVERAFNALQPAVRYTLDDIVELPECIERTVDITLGSKQAKVYKAMLDHCYVAVQNKEITAANAAAAMMKLLQIATGWVYSDNGTVSLDNDDRLVALVDAINATDRKVLVFAPFKHALEGISTYLTKEGISHETVSGDTSVNNRSTIFNLFQNTDKYKVIAAHPQCLAHGLTLTAADTIVWFAPIPSLEIYEQANARIRRYGQAHKQLILHFQGTPVEKKLYQLLASKQKIQDKLLDMFEEASK